jgi:acyl carrier protein
MRSEPGIGDALDATAVVDAEHAPTLRQDIEETVAGIWAEVLGIDHVGLHDNFLLLGGESLLATQVASEIRSRLGCDVSIRSIFVGTIAEVAAEISASISKPGVQGAARHR